MGDFITVTMADGALVETYRAAPQGARRGGLVLLQEIFGLTQHIQAQCDRFAAAGFEVLAPSLFDRAAPGLRLSYDEAGWRQAIALLHSHAFDLGVDDAATCVERLRPAGPVFVLGYCYGGSIAWTAASQLPGLSGSVCYYGGKLPAIAALPPLSPVLVHLGRDDAEIPMRETRDALERHPSVEVLTYPAGHGFNSDRRPDFDPLSAELAFRETLRFLDRHASTGLPPASPVVAIS